MKKKGSKPGEEKTTTCAVSDVLNIAGDLVPELDAVMNELLDRGKHERVMILAGTEGGKNRQAYAVTEIEIEFEDERNLRNCVRMLRWSDAYYSMFGATPNSFKIQHKVLAG